jgi:hypothetical protein
MGEMDGNIDDFFTKYRNQEWAGVPRFRQIPSYFFNKMVFFIIEYSDRIITDVHIYDFIVVYKPTWEAHSHYLFYANLLK